MVTFDLFEYVLAELSVERIIQLKTAATYINFSIVALSDEL